MKKAYLCEKCQAQFEAEDEVFSAASAVCPVCGETQPCSDFAEMNFCPYCQKEIAIQLGLPPGTPVRCQYCGGVFNTDRAASLENESLPEEEPASAEFAPGELFDKFEIIRRLGKGGTGEVYLAKHLLFKRPCALKILTEEAGRDSVAAARFIQEARLSNQLTHPNIVHVTDTGRDLRTGRLFLAMEYVEGWSLAQVLQEQQSLNESEALLVGIEICKALEALEAAGIVHRDIKPSNIMIDREGHIKLTDLGIARSQERQDEALTLTQEHVVFGTPYYAAPEQCRSAHAADSRSDLYSLGASLFHLTGGVPPYTGSDPLDIVAHVLQDAPPDLHKIRPELSPAFVRLIGSMMQKDPALRPFPAAEARQRMEAIASGRRMYLPAMFPRLKLRLRKNRRTLPVMIGLALLILAVSAVSVLSRPVRKRPAPESRPGIVEEVQNTAVPEVWKEEAPEPVPEVRKEEAPEPVRKASVNYRKLVEEYQKINLVKEEKK